LTGHQETQEKSDEKKKWLKMEMKGRHETANTTTRVAERKKSGRTPLKGPSPICLEMGTEGNTRRRNETKSQIAAKGVNYVLEGKETQGEH